MNIDHWLEAVVSEIQQMSDEQVLAIAQTLGCYEQATDNDAFTEKTADIAVSSPV